MLFLFDKENGKEMVEVHFENVEVRKRLIGDVSALAH